MKSCRVLATLFLLTASLGPVLPAASAQSASASEWTIGPVVRGRSLSPGMPLHPAQGRDGPTFAFPGPHERDGHVHYLTRPVGDLTRAREIVLRYRVDAAPGTRFVAQETPGETATVSLFLQRGGDNWSGRGAFAAYRWYSPPGTPVPLRPGTHTLRIALTPGWIDVNGQPASRAPDGFAQARREAQTVGVLFGSDSRRGHGVFATGPARFTVLDFTIR